MHIFFIASITTILSFFYLAYIILSSNIFESFFPFIVSLIILAISFSVVKHCLRDPEETKSYSSQSIDTGIEVNSPSEYPPYIPPKQLIPPYLCPYCKEEFPTEPRRKRKCPSCKETVHIKYHPDDPSKQKRLLTKQEANAIESAWDSHYEEEKWKSLQELSEQFSVSKSAVSQKVEELRKKNFSIKDAQWSIYNFIANELISTSSYQELSSLYYTMAIFVYDGGKDPYTLLKKSNEMSLRSLKKDFPDIKRVSILSTDDSCQACKELSKKTFTIGEALKTSPLPVRGCSRPLYKTSKIHFCRCTYSPDIQ